MRVVLFLIVFLASCDPPYEEDNPYLPNKQSLANEVRNETFAQLKIEKELYPCGVGSRMMDQIRMLALGFNYYKEVNIDQSRELLMAAATLFLKTINGKEQIRPYLKNNPFQPENIQIRIFLYKPNGSEPDLGKLTIISMIDGVLEYIVKNSETERLIAIYEESFEEAAAKLGTYEVRVTSDYGTSSMPPLCQGWHLVTLLTASQVPFQNPCLFTASSA